MAENDILDVLNQIKFGVKSQSSEQYIPTIIEFCESKHYLNLPAQGTTLYPTQRIILKVFYRGQPGNEDIELTPEELQLLFTLKLNNVIEKYHSGNLFKELVLVLGRRCISEDTLIFDAKTGESKSISDWHKNYRELNVWTYNEQCKKFEIHHAETLEQGIRECFRVTLLNEDYIDCTSNHPLLTPDGWKKIEDLESRDMISQNHISKLRNNEELNFECIYNIKSIGKKETYDLSVNQENCHNFMIGNGIQVHNSGKDFMVSLMALYEAMRLLEMPGGSPFRYYKLAEGNPIYILTVATSADQAKILFTEIKSKMMSSDYFRDKMPFVEMDRISLMTPDDKMKQKKIMSSGMENAGSRIKGSIVIMSGHSNSESLLGKRIYALLLDEVASFKTTGTSTSGDRIYSALGPATLDFKRETGKIKDDGNPEIVTDSKIISISSPRSEEGMLFKLYNDTQNTPGRLSFKLPTWKVSTRYNEESLRQEFKFMTASEFSMEFGAEFSGTAGEKFIGDKYVDYAMSMGTELGLHQRENGIPGMIYYAHLDPAATSHNYGLVVLHVEERIISTEKDGHSTREKVKMFVVDHIKIWQPGNRKAINVSEVENYVTELAKRFRFAMVSYDHWNSQASTQLLKRKGIPTKITPFRKQYKMAIYDNLHDLLVQHRIALPNKGPFAQLLEMELKCLKRIYTPTGFKIQPNLEGQVVTDDLTDSLAGACGIALENIHSGYPQSGVVTMPQSPTSGGNANWNIGTGRYSDQQWKAVHQKFGI